MVRAHLPVVEAAGGDWFDLDRMFAHVPAMREAGVTEFAVSVTGRLGGEFDSMEKIERYIHEIAAQAAKY